MKTTYTVLVSLLLSTVALGWAIANHLRAKEAEERLETLRRAHFRLSDQAREQIGGLEKEVRSLGHRLRAATGEGLFTPDLTIGEALELHPRVAEVLSGFHIGGCSSCAVDSDDTLRYAIQGNGQDEAVVLGALNKLASGEEEEIARLLERKPNVQLSL